jgi:LTXXQ motif family protein
MKVRISHPLSRLSVVAVLAFAPLAASAQNAPMMGGEMKGGNMMGDGMKGCDAMGGDMKGCVGGDMENMQRMMSMMHEKLSHAGDRIASLKTELKITEAQMPAWNKFSDVLIASAKSMEEPMDAMHKRMQSGVMLTLPEKLDHYAQMAAAHITNLQTIKAALDPLYASFSDEQKKLADGLKIGPMGLM